jgi:2-oxoglutarate ferredoxin oxidoreductase subunit alpha
MTSIQIYGAGRAGDGTNANIAVLGEIFKDLGAWTFRWLDEVYSNIQTRDSGFAMRASDRPIFGPDDEYEILQAFDEGAFIDIVGEGRVPPITRLKPGGTVLYDSSPRLMNVNAGHEIHIEKYQDILDEKRARVFGMPFGQMAVDEVGSGLYNARNVIPIGVIAHMIGIPKEIVLERLAKTWGGTDSSAYKANEKLFLMGMEHAEKEGWDIPDLKVDFPKIENDTRQVLIGNYAVAAGAIVAGCRVYAGYPITPASEVLEYMAEHIHEFGGAFIQADSEMAAAHHVIGAAVAGARSMTATAGPGFSLMRKRRWSSSSACAAAPRPVFPPVRARKS